MRLSCRIAIAKANFFLLAEMSHFSAANSNTQQFTEFHDGLLSAYRADVFDADISMQSAHSNRSTSDPQLSTPKSYKGQDYLDALRALPELRPIPWKPGHELPLEKTTEHTRVQTRGAFLLVTRGRFLLVSSHIVFSDIFDRQSQRSAMHAMLPRYSREIYSLRVSGGLVQGSLRNLREFYEG